MAFLPQPFTSLVFLAGLTLTVGSNSSYTQQPLLRPIRDIAWNDQPALYAPAGLTAEGEVRSPILLELRRDLVPANGPGGLYGVCTRVYRVLYGTRLQPMEECRLHHNSRQSVLGDITEFYHTLVESGRFNQTLEFPLADRFRRFSFRASFMYFPSKGNEPAVMIETDKQYNHVLCVEHIRCPEQTTTSPPPPPPSPTLGLQPSPTPPLSQGGEDMTFRKEMNKNRIANHGSQEEGKQLSVSESSAFWISLPAGTDPMSWFLATVSLSCACLILLIVLIITWLYICRLRRLHARRRCRGTCRYGCRCPDEVIRQTVNNAAVCGPLDTQNTHLLHSPMSPHGNGSIRSGSGFGGALFSGGTMTSSRWGGSNGGHKLGSPIYVSMGNAQDKTVLLSANATPTCMLQSPGNIPVDTTNISNWHQANGQRSSSQVNRRRLSQDAICRSISEGSSVSGHPVTNNNNNSTNGPKFMSTSQASSNQATYGTNCIGSTAGQPTMLISNVNTSQPMDSSRNGPIYYPTPFMGYTFSDGVRAGGVNPAAISQSPTRLSGRKQPDRSYYNPSGSTGPVTEEDEGIEQHANSFFQSAADKLPGSPDPVETCTTFNSYGHDSMHQTSPYPMRGSEGDLVNITPPSGFYDPNGSAVDSGLVTGSLASSGARSTNHQITSGGPNSFGTRPSFTSPLYPILGSPASHSEWSNVPPMASNAEMVGVVDMEGISRVPVNMSESAMFRPCDIARGYASPKQTVSSRIYAASERML
ncbi:uncharacterized protein DEA37_0003647 [Paragonimus westermani]|uniref:Ephrin RBD domain-containing protein n=1 Tax=Paragonimus westermani TaxID=34504 RepID=A0A5J4P224_9TREM|nr:uncharacterized protein DEA37_0003647 [Paragonimus westermani]